jgi:hypothetical protein
MPVNTFTPAGDSSFAAPTKTGSDWTTVIGASQADSILDPGATDSMFQARLQGGTFTNRRGFMYFDLAESSIPKKAQFLKLRRAQIKLTFSSRAAGDTNGTKFKFFALNAKSAGFNPHTRDYDNYLPNVSSDIFDVTGAGELTFTIKSGKLLRWLETKIRRRADLYLMARAYHDLQDVDPAANNRAIYRSPTYGTAAQRPKLVIEYKVADSRMSAGGGFSSGNVITSSRNGFARF